MDFLTVPVAQAAGAMLAHSVQGCAGRLAKGTLLEARALQSLMAAGVTQVPVVRLKPDDIPEDVAAARVAHACAGPGLCVQDASTGRCNLHASTDGILVLDASAIHRFNAVDEALTMATLLPWTPVRSGTLAATVKVIPFAVPRDRLEQACSVWSAPALLRVQPYVVQRVRLIQTRLGHTREAVLDKTRATLVERLTTLSDQLQLVDEVRCDHDPGAVAAALLQGAAELFVLCGASAMADPGDVLPAALRLAGGRVERMGMPVEPGNLLMLGTLNGASVIGMPGCARSPKPNGFDAVLARCAAGSMPTSDEIARLGVGGLLAERPARPTPASIAMEAVEVDTARSGAPSR